MLTCSLDRRRPTGRRQHDPRRPAPDGLAVLLALSQRTFDAAVAVSYQRLLVEPQLKKPRNPSAITARYPLLDGSTSTMVSDVWIWPRART